jgi:hypothetical protein
MVAHLSRLEDLSWLSVAAKDTGPVEIFLGPALSAPPPDLSRPRSQSPKIPLTCHLEAQRGICLDLNFRKYRPPVIPKRSEGSAVYDPLKRQPPAP